MFNKFIHHNYMFAPRNAQSILIGDLPTPNTKLYGVYHFPEERACLFTLSPQGLVNLYPDASEDEKFPSSLLTAVHFAVYFKVHFNLNENLPITLRNCYGTIASIHFRSILISCLESFMNLVRGARGNSHFKHLVAHVCLFRGTSGRGIDMRSLSYVLFSAIEWQMTFDISVQLDNMFYVVEVLPRHIDMRSVKQGYMSIIAKLRDIFKIDGTAFPLRAYSLNDHSRLVFIVDVERTELFPEGVRMHFYNDVKPKTKDPEDQFVAFDNLTFCTTKPFFSGLNLQQMDMGFLGLRGSALQTSHVIFGSIELRRLMGNYLPHDRIPLWESEVHAYLDLKVYIDGFGRDEPGRENSNVFARRWQTIKVLDQMNAYMFTPALMIMICEMVF